jgi:hypothetical protein
VYTSDELEDAEPSTRIQPAATDILPEYPDADFQKNLPTYRKAIEAGRKSAAEIIATVSTKYTLTDTQRVELQSIKPTTSQEA